MRSRVRLAFIVTILVSLCSAQASDDTVARVCLQSTKGVIDAFPAACKTAPTAALKVPATDTERPFLWIEDGTTLLGTIPAHASAALRPMVRTFVLQLRSHSARWPARTIVQVTSSDGARVWRWVVPAREAGSRRSVGIARGLFDLKIEADGHQIARRPINTDLENVRLDPIDLIAVPVISGSVVLPARAPAVGAVITDAVSKKVLAVTGADGRFEAAIADNWPQSVEVSVGTLAVKTVDIPRSPSDLELPQIELGAGGTLVVDIDGAKEKVTIELRAGEHVVRSIVRTPGAAPLKIERIEPGRYELRIVGSQPLQRTSVRTTVDEGKTTDLRMIIDPRELEITTAIGANALPGATVSLTSVKFNWRAALTTDANGRVVAEVWQPGDYLAAVKSDAVGVPFVQMTTIDDVENPFLTLRLPDRRIQGKVVDAETGAPLPGIQVGLESTRLDGMTTALRTTTDDSGSFLFRSVGAGKQKLIADSDQYIRPEPVVFDIAESEQERDVNLRLKRGVETVTVFVDEHGGAVAGATVIEFASGSIAGIHTTDAGGTMKVSMPAGETRVFLVVPREGSFVIARVEAEQISAGVPTRVVVPPGVGTLDLITRSGRGEPIPNVFFLVRFNGELLPPEALQIFERVQGLRFATDSGGSRRLQHLPTGVYEFWPVANAREARNVLSNPAANAPTSVVVRAGGNSAVLTFAGVQKSESSKSP